MLSGLSCSSFQHSANAWELHLHPFLHQVMLIVWYSLNFPLSALHYICISVQLINKWFQRHGEYFRNILKAMFHLSSLVNRGCPPKKGNGELFFLHTWVCLSLEQALVDVAGPLTNSDVILFLRPRSGFRVVVNPQFLPGGEFLMWRALLLFSTTESFGVLMAKARPVHSLAVFLFCCLCVANYITD